jgi:glyoxylase-like metal-dependent hydrolase (beta-lactamase superfamily II)
MQVIHTPGHTPGGICIYIKSENIVFSGDTLFCGSVGRTDFEGGSMEELLYSIKTKLFTLPESTIVYTGHEQKTSIGYEKMNNFFIR